VAVEFDAELTALAAEILSDAARVFAPGETARLLPGFNPGLNGMFGGPSVTGSFAAVTASFAALTTPFPAGTGSVAEALTGAFKALGQEPAPKTVTPLRAVFRLPSRLPGVRLQPEPALAAIARSARTMTSLDALARWLGKDGRPVSGDDQLAAGDAASACERLGIPPEYLPYLWEYALAAGWFVLVEPGGAIAGGAGDAAAGGDGVADAAAAHGAARAVIGPTAWRWAEGDDPGALRVWAVIFAAVAARALDVAATADEQGSRRLNLRGQGIVLAVMLFLARHNGLTMRELQDLVKEDVIGEYPASRARRAWQSWVRTHGDPARLVLNELVALGAVSLPPTADEPVVLTALGSWALREQFRHEGITVPVLAEPSAQMSAADLVAFSDGVSDAEFAVVFPAWIRERGPDRAARELFVFAASSAPRGRLAAISIVRRIGASAHRAWRDAMQRPELSGYARITLDMMAEQLPESTMPLVLEPDPTDLAGVAADLLALAGSGDDLDLEEFVARFAEAVPAGEEGRVFGQMAQSSHPDIARLLDLLTSYHPDRQIARDARQAARAVAKHRKAKTAAGTTARRALVSGTRHRRG